MTQSRQNKKDEVAAYIASVPVAARPKFDELRILVQQAAPQAREVFSYGILGYKIDNHRARVFVSGWKDHVAMYPVPDDEHLRAELAPFIKGKGTLWFALDKPLPRELLTKVVVALISS